QTVLAVDVHRVRAAHAFAAGAAERDRWIEFLELDQGVQQHALMTVELHLHRLHVGLGIFIGIVAIDFESTLHFGMFFRGLRGFRRYGPWAVPTARSAA